MTPMTKDREPYIYGDKVRVDGSATVFLFIRENVNDPTHAIVAHEDGFLSYAYDRLTLVGSELEAKISGQQEAKLLELVRQAAELLGPDIGLSEREWADRRNDFLYQSKEVVPDLLVDGGDIPLPPSPTEP